MSDRDDLQVVTVSSVFEETPEGMYRMDRLRRECDPGVPAGLLSLAAVEDLELAIDRAIFFGTGTG